MVAAIPITSIIENYGGKAALLRAIYAKWQSNLGGFKQERQVDWEQVKRLVFVCRGNINRSAYAAEYSSHCLNFPTASCGLETDNGLSASDHAIANGALRGTDLSHHKTTRLEDIEHQAGDLYIVFEPEHANLVRERLGNPDTMVTILGLWSNNPCPYIQDPICRSDTYFQACFERTEQGVNGILKKLNHAAKSMHHQ